ncbi:hypothetical protein AQUCO_00400379v1 [Aquilegia coerulea]|uniref:Uncharacterized protein n=1 Tax=Aquilegia coerulea TaxID=218851 RepID=A0A2G5EUL7_AQUCA|nr:hypothetical protein AQUCO_00400379v1 [Aquilegia coerulea]
MDILYYSLSHLFMIHDIIFQNITVSPLFKYCNNDQSIKMIMLYSFFYIYIFRSIHTLGRGRECVQVLCGDATCFC